MRRKHPYAAVVAALFFILPTAIDAAQWPELARMIGERDAVVVAAPDGRPLFARNADTQCIPASTLKLLTALAALHHLGPDYRYATEFFITPEHHLIIKGYGDPLLISERVSEIAVELAKRIDRISGITLDDSYFASPMEIPGTASTSIQPYDAPVGALCVNFNTVNFELENGAYVSAEPQTPMLPTARNRLQSTSQPLSQGRMLLSSQKRENLMYAGELFRYFLEHAGIAVDGNIRAGRVNEETSRLVFEYRSPHPLTEIISGLMTYSNNFIANQLLITTGAHVHGPPGTLAKGLRVARDFANRELGIHPVIVEGSGISRENRMTAEMFLPVLDAFAPYHQLMTRTDNVYCKTGTLNGIETRAGYIEKDGGLFRFAVMINTAGRKADPVVEAIKSRINGGRSD